MTKGPFVSYPDEPEPTEAQKEACEKFLDGLLEDGLLEHTEAMWVPFAGYLNKRLAERNG